MNNKQIEHDRLVTEGYAKQAEKMEKILNAEREDRKQKEDDYRKDRDNLVSNQQKQQYALAALLWGQLQVKHEQIIVQQVLH